MEGSHGDDPAPKESKYSSYPPPMGDQTPVRDGQTHPPCCLLFSSIPTVGSIPRASVLGESWQSWEYSAQGILNGEACGTTL